MLLYLVNESKGPQKSKSAKHTCRNESVNRATLCHTTSLLYCTTFIIVGSEQAPLGIPATEGLHSTNDHTSQSVTSEPCTEHKDERNKARESSDKPPLIHIQTDNPIGIKFLSNLVY